MQWGRCLSKNLEFKLKNRFLDANKKEATLIQKFAANETGVNEHTRSTTTYINPIDSSNKTFC